MSIDALLLLSFGGPEQPDDVMPFLRIVTSGRNVGDERLAVVADQYQRFGGRSPINDQCRALVEAIEADFVTNGIELPVYWGNRNWHPFLADTVAQMADDGVTDALVFATSAFGSYSGCRQYREDLIAAAEAVGERAPRLSKLRLFYDHPGFIEPMADHLAAALGPGPARIVFTAHSIPESMAAGCDYEAQLNESARLVLECAGLGREPTSGVDGVAHDLVFQSRSGPPSIPWLGPDVNDHIESLAEQGWERVVLVPIGFVSDHMEVQFDLDTQAAATAERCGVALTRVPTVGTDARFVTMIRQLVEERTSGAARLSLGPSGPWPDECPTGHCPPPARRPA